MRLGGRGCSTTTSDTPTDIRTLVDDFATRFEQIIHRTALEQDEQPLGGVPSAPRLSPGGPRKTAATRPAAKGGQRIPASLDEMQGCAAPAREGAPRSRCHRVAEALKTSVRLLPSQQPTL